MIKIYNLTFVNEVITSPHKAILAVYKQNEIINKKNTLEYLSDVEIKLLGKITNNSHKTNFLNGRYCAKKAIMELTKNNNPKRFSITNGIFGQPIVSGLEINNLQVSISHGNNYCIALAFFEECPMAIDMEEIDLVREESISSQITQHEALNIIPLINNHPLLVLWSAKESLSKVIKTGLNIDFELLEINHSFENNQIVEGIFTNFNQYKFLSFFNKSLICTITFPQILTLINKDALI